MGASAERLGKSRFPDSYSVTSQHKVNIKLALMAAALVAILVGHFVQKGQNEQRGKEEARLGSLYASELRVEPLMQREYISEEGESGNRTTIVRDVAYAVLTNPTQITFCNIQVQMDYTADGSRSVETLPAAFTNQSHVFLGPGETLKNLLGGYDPSSRLKIWRMSVISARPCPASADR